MWADAGVAKPYAELVLGTVGGAIVAKKLLSKL
jgi:hypothetical protein